MLTEVCNNSDCFAESFRRGNALWQAWELRGVGVNSSIVLVSAVLASLAVGVLVAYGVCIAMFGAFQMHVTSGGGGQWLHGRVVSAQAVLMQVS